MADALRAGSRLGSAVCDTEVVVVRAPDGPIDVRCGGVPMAEVGAGRTGEPIAPHDGGTLVGKRYVDPDDTLELLCSKAGAGSLSVGDQVLTEKGAKPLPSSD